MPYIKAVDRVRIDDALDGFIHFIEDTPVNVGEANYAITRILIALAGDNPNYEKLNGIVGMVESAKAEFQRRKVNVYEDSKIKSNGDVDGYK